MKKRTAELKGRAVSGGIAVGLAEIQLEDPSVVPEYGLGSDEEAEAEVGAFEAAIEEADREAAADLEWARGNLPESEAEIFATHRAILRDPTLVEWVTVRIRQDRVNAAAAVRQRFDEFRAILAASDSEIIRNRILDVSDAERLILMHLLGYARSASATDDDGGDRELRILVANNPPPSMLARLDPERVCGLLCEASAGGGHVAVLARALNLPTLIQVKDLLAKVRDGDTIAIDADQGTALVNPAESQLSELRARARQLRILLPPQPSDPRALRVTADGRRIHLLGNASSQREVDAAARVDADGIGLYRTEVLFLARRRLPSESELSRVYSQAACSFVSEPIDIRLLDLGSDKHLSAASGPRESNPALGLRALRFLFAHPEILRTQLRAILKAGADGPLRILLPMVSGAHELARVREMAAECHEELRKAGIRHAPDLPIGAMIEHPAGMMLAREIIEEADFVSIGTNDLTMYMLAVDRDAAHLSAYYEPCHPAVLRAIRDLAALGHELGRPVSICGELASDPSLTGLLLGLGVDRLSMNPQWIVPVGQILGTLDVSRWQEIAAEAASLPSPEAVRSHLRAVGTTD